ncbi:hypothetical protein TA3x_004411 [Tundrisphaera sp. TA3]|uniref:hypothetical protein n=1 Tax=Tundrisphaera sp. TA3 TaxID=3435775 RepID=UPI003EBFF1A5
MALSLAAVQPPAAMFREDQRFGWWLYALLALMMGIEWSMLMGHGQALLGIADAKTAAGTALGIAVGLGMPILLLVGVLRMTTVVALGEVRVWFGWIPTYRRSIPIASIRGVHVVQYRPMRDYGGWGIRQGRDGERVLNARGNRGVRLILEDQTQILIGSQRPEELARAIESIRHPGL